MSELGAWLQEHSPRVASLVTARQFEDSELERRYGAHGRERCTQDNVFHLDSLRVAVTRGSPALFLDYVAWVRVLLAGLKIPEADLAKNLEHLQEVLAAEAPPAFHSALLPLLTRAREALPGLPTSVPGFIQPGEPHAGLARRYLDLLLGGDRQGAARAIAEASAAGVPVRELYLYVFQRALREVGRLWQTNAITVAHEHYCTAATQLVMSQLYPRIFSTERRGRTLVATCIEGDLHEVGLRMVADFFELDGWDTHYLGANVPSASVVSTIAERKPDVVAVSATLTRHVPQVAELVSRLRGATAGVHVLVGGYPFNVDPQLWKAVGADAHALDADQAVGAANGLLAGGAHA